MHERKFEHHKVASLSVCFSLIKGTLHISLTRSLGPLHAPTSRWRPFDLWAFQLRLSPPSVTQAVWPLINPHHHNHLITLFLLIVSTAPIAVSTIGSVSEDEARALCTFLVQKSLVRKVLFYLILIKLYVLNEVLLRFRSDVERQCFSSLFCFHPKVFNHRGISIHFLKNIKCIFSNIIFAIFFSIHFLQNMKYIFSNIIL